MPRRDRDNVSPLAKPAKEGKRMGKSLQSVGAPTGTVPRGKIAGGGNWQSVNRWDAWVVAAGSKHGVDPAFLKAVMVIESGGDANAADPHGAIGLMQVKPQFWGDVAAGLGYDLLIPAGQIGTAAAILGGTIPWVKGKTPEERFLSTYYPTPGLDVPGESGHTPRMYLQDVALYMGIIYAAAGPVPGPRPNPDPVPPPLPPVGPMVTIAGIPHPVALTVPFRQALIPRSQTNQRPGTPMRARFYTQHDTGNRGRGANAEMHRRYMADGAPDANGNPQQLGYHFTVDDREIVQMVPVDEIAWHAGDGSGPGNMSGVACELCINEGVDTSTARENAAMLAAAVMNGLALGAAALKKHQDWSGKWCPQDILGDGDWPAFVWDVSRRLGVGPSPTPSPTPKLPSKLAPIAASVGLTDTDLVARFGSDADPNGPVTTLWAEEGARTGMWPRLVTASAPGAVRDFTFSNSLWIRADAKGVRIVRENKQP